MKKIGWYIYFNWVGFGSKYSSRFGYGSGSGLSLMVGSGSGPTMTETTNTTGLGTHGRKTLCLRDLKKSITVCSHLIVN
jgi:hypothetical protein